MKYVSIVIATLMGTACCAPTGAAFAQPAETGFGRLEVFGPPQRARSAAQPNPLVDSLVAYYGMEEASGTRYDGHGTNHLTAYGNPGDTVGVIGRAATFDNTIGQYLQSTSPQLAVMQGDWSVMFWVRVGNVNSTLKMIISRGIGYSCPTIEYGMYAQNGNNVVRGCSGSSTQAVFIADPSSWRHIAITYCTSIDSLFVFENGTQIKKEYLPGTIVSYAPFTIAAASSGQYHFIGYIDEVYYWRGFRLSSTFLVWYYNSGSGRSYTDITSLLP